MFYDNLTYSLFDLVYKYIDVMAYQIVILENYYNNLELFEIHWFVFLKSNINQSYNRINRYNNTICFTSTL